MEQRASDNGMTCRFRTRQSSQLTEHITACIKQEVAEGHCERNSERYGEIRNGCCESFGVFLTKVECKDSQGCSVSLNDGVQSTPNEDKPFNLTITPVKDEEDQLGSVFSDPRSRTLLTEVRQEGDCKVEVEDHELYKFDPGLGKQEVYDECTECCKHAQLREHTASDLADAGKPHVGTFVDTCNIKLEYDAHLVEEGDNKHAPQVEVFVCFTCNYAVTDKDCLRRHMKRCRNNTAQNCSKTQRQKNQSVNTTAPHPFASDPYQCAECEFTNKSRSALNRHITMQHSADVPVYQCAKCNYTTKWKHHLSTHIKIVHSSRARLYKCPRCDYAPKHKKNLIRHLKFQHSTNAKLHKCTVCDFATKHAYYLTRHVTIKHRLDAPVYRCTRCDFATKLRSYLTKHVTIRHNSDAPVYQCAKCSYTSKLKNHLSTHIKVLHNKHPELYKCPHCDYAPKHKKNLTQHLKLQHDPKVTVYECKDCDFTTKLRYHLNNHVTAKHSPDAPVHRCPECSYTTKVKYRLCQHIKNKHGDPA